MEFRILGPLALASGAANDVGGPRERKILAALVLMANEPVSTQYLIDVVWHEAPPSTARQQVQNCVGAIRSRLRRSGISAEIARRATSYSLQLCEEQADVLVFRRLCADADRFAARGDIVGSCAHLRNALALWRGHALEDIDSEVLTGRAAALEECRVRAIEQYVRLEITQDRAGEILADLFGWIRQYPYHEGLHGFLAESLEKVGRTAEAIRVLQQLRHRLRDDLGIKAGAAVLEVEQRLLLRSSQPRSATGPAAENRGDLVRTIESAMSSLSAVLDILAHTNRLGLSGPGNDPGVVTGR
ncbi:AfsR/SARP family transcriptional regulator [Plantactinospora sp. CA-290183]|uniref:AfsR/SARP family transcriptional regulator n=1 Tax=Plantactinospora sp. CA-290183 TaxID=3240006 RepID=UPI003D902774